MHADAAAPPEVHALHSAAAELAAIAERLWVAAESAPRTLRHRRVLVVSAAEVSEYLRSATTALRFAAEVLAEEGGAA
jgi:hypothetical protein